MAAEGEFTIEIVQYSDVELLLNVPNNDSSCLLKLVLQQPMKDGGATVAQIEDDKVLKDAYKFNSDKYHLFIVDMSLVVSEFQIKLASYKAVSNVLTDRMKTKSLTAEIMFYLSLTGKITEAMVQYSYKPCTTKDIAFVFVSLSSMPIPSRDECIAIISRGKYLSKGTIVNDNSSILSTIDDAKASNLTSYFKINPKELISSSLENCIISRLAVKDVV